MNKKLNTFWENEVEKANKHFVNELPPEKTERMLKRVNEHILSHLNFDQIHTALDWGSGGGLFSQILARHSTVIAADISQESLNETKRYLDDDSLKSLLIPENPNELKLPDVPIDLVFCHAVIHHFPSLEYRNKVFDIWLKSIRPKYFGLQIKIGEENTEKDNYFQGENYLNALYLNEEEFTNNFTSQGYTIKHRAYEINRYSNPEHIMKVGYFVFEKE